MRGTVFAAAAEDLVWTTELGGPRQLRASATRRRGHGITEGMLDAAFDTAVITITGQSSLGHFAAASVAEIGEAWERAGIPTDAGRRYHLLYSLMAAGRLAYGPIHRRPSTGTLLQLVVIAEEWLPSGAGLSHRFNGDEDAAIAHWLHRYLWGHGPATLRDFSWWTKLPLGRIRAVAAPVLTEFERYGHDHDGDAFYGRPGLWEERTQARSALRRAKLLAPSTNSYSATTIAFDC